VPDFRAAGDGYLLSWRADQKRGGLFFAASFESIGSIDNNNKSIRQNFVRVLLCLFSILLCLVMVGV
jgi:hypothetical protein